MEKPFIIIMHGGTVAGKTTLAKALAKYLDIKLLSTSQIKHEKNWWGYDISLRKKVFSLLLSRIKKNIKENNSVVVDSTYSLRCRREKVYQFCCQKNISLYIINCVCEDQTEIKKRLVFRAHEEPNSPDSEAKTFKRWQIEKLKIESLLADKFLLPKKVFIIIYDTHRQIINQIFLLPENKPDKLVLKILNFLKSYKYVPV